MAGALREIRRLTLSLGLSFFIVAAPSVGTSQVGVGGYVVTVEQLNLYSYVPPVVFSNIGMINLVYNPDFLDFYLNIVALDNQQQPQWIVRNLYLPDLSWIGSAQTISPRFDFQMLGVAIGEQVPMLNLGIQTTEGVLDQMPNFADYTPIPVDTLGEDVDGDVTNVPISTPQLGDIPPYPEFTPNDTVTHVEYRGCRVPNIDLDDSTNPDSETYAGDKNACGPASAANSLKWLSDVNSGISITDDVRTVLQELSGYMNRARNGGVTIDQFVKGKLDYIEAKGLSINVKFQSRFVTGNISSTSGTTHARNDNTGTYPTWAWLKQQVDDGEDVELCYHWWDGEKWRGHAVVVTGIEESANGRHTVKFKHDRKQRSAGGTTQEPETIYVDAQGRMVLRSRNAFVGSAIAESPGDPLPVELSYFAASVAGTSVTLNWRTATEKNNYGFEIRRNGEKITFISGHGTVSEPRDYSYADQDLSPGTYRYGLVQIDLDGTRSAVSDAVAIVGNPPQQFALGQNYPNPFNAATRMSYAIPEKGLVSLKVYNLLGEAVMTLVNEWREAGRYEVPLDAGALEAGVYFYRLEANGKSETRKLVLLK